MRGEGRDGEIEGDRGAEMLHIPIPGLQAPVGTAS